MRSLILLVIFCLCLGCTKKELVRNDLSLEYKNYLSQDSIPHSIISLFRKVECDSFDADFSKKVKLEPLKGEVYDYFSKNEFLFEYEFQKEKSLYGDYDDHPFIMPKYDLGEIYIAGKIKYHEGVEGLILLFKSSETAMFADGSVCFDINLFVVKDSKLCSVVRLSSFSKKDNEVADYLRTYKTGKECYTQVDFSGMINIQSPNITKDDEINIFTVLKKKIGFERKIKRLGYTMFYIDEIGFVRYISSVGTVYNQLPSILTQTSNWNTINFIGGVLM